MISKNNLKYVKSLQLKKIRKEEGKFLVEGGKSILELLDSDYTLNQLLVTDKFFATHSTKIEKLECAVIITDEKTISEMSSFASNNSGIAVVISNANNLVLPDKYNYTLILDGINDPGNLGTIIRSADWFGIKNIIASNNTSELYNPKVIGASMGSFARVNIFYTNLTSYLEAYRTHVYAAVLEGKSIHQTTFRKTASMLLMGNESHGISKELLSYVDDSVFIPRFGNAESLNVGIATAIFLDHIKNN